MPRTPLYTPLPAPGPHPLAHEHECRECGKVVGPCTNGECLYLRMGTCADKCGRRDPTVRG